ncbi:MAG: hypothetical protein IKU29_03840 [Parabacteroides sp.]|nr:hypothetical protein [Parabacteroides sp.]
MKYWECINVPGKTGVVVSDDVFSTSSDESNYISPVLECKELTPEEKKEIVETVRDRGNNIVEPMPHMFSNEKVDDFSEEYKRVFNQAFNRGVVKINSVPGTDGVSVSVPTDSQTTETISGLMVKTDNTGTEIKDVSSVVFVARGETDDDDHPSEENDNKYISVDEVDESNYDNTGEFEVPDLTLPDDSKIEISHPTENTIMITETFPKTENNQLDKDSIKESLLAGIFGNVGEEIADKVVDKLAEKVSEPEVVEVEVEPEYSLDEKQLNDVVETFNRYEREYFGELTPEHFSTRFLRNIPKHVYRAHQDCVDKYEAPDILDPLFFMYIMLTEDPYFAMGKFINIIRNKLKSDKTWSDAVDNLEIEYDEYIADFAEENEEDDADAPSEETTDDASESND